MACPSLLQSSASSFHGRFPSLSAPSYAQVSLRKVVKVSASGTVLWRNRRRRKSSASKTRSWREASRSQRRVQLHQHSPGDAAQNDKGLEAAMKEIALYHRAEACQDTS